MSKKKELSRRQAQKLLEKARRRYNQEHQEEASLLRSIRVAKRKEREVAKELRAKVRLEKKKLRNLKGKARKAEERRVNPHKFLRRMAPWLFVPKEVKKEETDESLL